MAREMGIFLLKKLQDIWQNGSQTTPNRYRYPEISQDRRDQSAQEKAFDLPHALPSTSCLDEKKEPTVLYLAYGSNLASSVFRGVRGIRPLAAINVLAPEFMLTFDLPGIPYSEPCFANTRYRHTTSSISRPSSVQSDPSPPPQYPPSHNPTFPTGLVGVVYEVTLSEYAHIVATEGGGKFYHDVLTTCYPLPSSAHTVPTIPTSKPFKAHTLYSPISIPGEAPPDTGKGVVRPDPDYAQPSLRYLNLLRVGADENGLPDDFKAYLHELQPYTITSRRQELGAFIFGMLWRPFILLIFALSRRYQDDKGRTPEWLGRLASAVFIAMWANYDGFFYDIFGDGERTQPPGRDEESAHLTGMSRVVGDDAVKQSKEPMIMTCTN